jgi:hypothetical protein
VNCHESLAFASFSFSFSFSLLLFLGRHCTKLFGRPSPSPKISDFENPSDSDSACLFVYALILYRSQHFTRNITCIRELKTTEKAELVLKCTK